MSRQRRSFGKIRKLPSGYYQASYLGADGVRYLADRTFERKIDAEGFLAVRRSELVRDAWLPPAPVKPDVLTVAEYAERWLAARELTPKTRRLYRGLLDGHVLPVFGTFPLDGVSAAAVRDWHGALAIATGKTRRAHAYGLLRTILNTAIDEELIGANPCRIKGAGSTRRVVRIEPATTDELVALVAAMPERYAVMVLLGAWCALRLGELSELRRKDVDLKQGLLKVRRAVTFVDGEFIVGDPKTEAGKRDVHVPPHLLPAVRQHILSHAGPGLNGLLFPSPTDAAAHLNPSSFEWHWRQARKTAGRPTLRFHDTRHTGATLAAQAGATLAELMARLGHTTANAAMRYQHAAAGRDAEIARRLSDMVAPAAVVIDLDQHRQAQ
jgi:integrase